MIPNLQDSPLRWHDVDPSARYVIKWEALPANLDCPYTCAGVPVPAVPGCQEQACTEPISSNLYLFEYNVTSSTWDKIFIDRAWAGTSVGFDFVTFKNVQLVAYYGADQNAKMAQRVRRTDPVLGKVWGPWNSTDIGMTFAGWDSHNYLTIAIDTSHVVHVSGNMHASSVNYFKGTGIFGKDANLTYQRQAMPGENTKQATYPRFLRSPEGELLFMYLNRITTYSAAIYLNKYDERTQTWTPCRL